MGRRSAQKHAFTLMDVIMSMAVIATLMALLLPSLTLVRETSRRVACASNVRQIGLGLAMYGDDHHEMLPPSALLGAREGPVWDQMVQLRLGMDERWELPAGSDGWDGLGRLYADAYLPAGRLFYCPSHKGEHPYERYQSLFNPAAAVPTTGLVCNYQYRGIGPNGSRKLWRIEPTHSALVSDTIRAGEELSHVRGANVLRADISIFWFSDGDGVLKDEILAMGALGAGGRDRANATAAAWELFDEFSSPDSSGNDRDDR